MTASAPTPGPPSAQLRPSTRFIARQAILTREEQVFGYELLFRGGMENYFGAGNTEVNEASRSTLDSSILMGLDVLCDGRRAFINCTREVLLRDYILLLPSSHTVAEVLESVPPDQEVVAACQRLKEAGYMIALDDFAVDDPRASLTDFADIIKVDMRATSAAQRLDLIKKYGPWRCRMLAEKVETQEEFHETRQAGFLYFQGYFFRRPEMVATREIPANRVHYMRMIQAVASAELDLREIEKLIKSEASLCYRLLRYMNSAAFAFAHEIHSVRHALSLLGEKEIRRWVRLVAMLGAGKEKSSDLVLTALVRARFCELLAEKVPHGDSDLFLMGLLSLMDAILELPMAQIVENIPLDIETKSVLLGKASRLRPLYQLMLAWESGEWESAAQLQQQLGLQENEASEANWQAMQWAREVSGG
ncbi:MAG: HDOD domain-containing protein [Acidobacteria bacterium]|jgi:EAL and modified HD-GYP domain-containing signal transduction protein|nr:HDOD domain-containing protein [Acidobacteriota bacterium]